MTELPELAAFLAQKQGQQSTKSRSHLHFFFLCIPCVWGSLAGTAQSRAMYIWDIFDIENPMCLAFFGC